jgi:hypothetical protein
MSLPDVQEFRRRVENVNDEPIRYCLMTLYLFCGRISEVVAQAYKTDRTVARGPQGTDARLDVYRVGDMEFPAVVFTVHTAKRHGFERKVAVPADPEYEPWAQPVYEYFKKHEDKPVFPFTQQYVRYRCYKLGVFKGLTYTVETYPVWKNKVIVKRVKRHSRPFTLHAIRHLRASELVDFYGFSGAELAVYGGWTFHTVLFPAATDRYLSLGWQSYFPKLLKKRQLG